MADVTDADLKPVAAPAPAPEVTDNDLQPVRGTAGELGSALVRGAGEAIRGVGATISGGSPGPISSAIKSAGTAVSGLAGPAQPETHGGVTNFISQLAEGGVGSAPMIAADVAGRVGGGAIGAIGGAPAAGVGAVPGAIAGSTVGASAAVAAQQYRQVKDEALDHIRAAQPNISDADAQAYAEKKAAASAAIWGGVSALAPEGAIGAKILGRAAPKTAAEVGARIAETAGKSPLAEGAKSLAKGAVLPVAGMVGQAATNAKIDQDTGLPTITPWEAAKGAIPGALGAGIGFGLFHAYAEATNVRTALKVQEALKNTDNPFRVQAVNNVIGAMKKIDPAGAQMFALNAQEALKQGKPIGLDDSWTTGGGHPSVFPKASQEMPEETMEGEGGGQTQGTQPPQQPLALPAPGQVPQTPGENETPFGVSQAHAQQNAADNAAQLQASRDAYEAQQAALRASGPLGAAAAAAHDSGAVAQKAETRQADVSPHAETPAETETGNPDVDAWLHGTPPLPLAEAQRRAAMDNAAGGPHQYTVIPHGDGYQTIPSRFLENTPEATQHAGLQSGNPDYQLPKMSMELGAAQKAADAHTQKSGREVFVTPSDVAHDKFKLTFTNPEGDQHAVGEQSTSEVGTQPGGTAGAGRPGEGEGVGLGHPEGQPNEQAGPRGEEAGADRGAVSGDVGPLSVKADEVTAAGNRRPRLTFGQPQGKHAVSWRKVTPDEQRAAQAIIDAHVDAGHEIGSLQDLNVGVYDKTATNGEMTVNPRLGQIGVRADVLHDVMSGAQSADDVSEWGISHEKQHVKDVHPDDPGRMMSGDHPAFEVGIDPGTGARIAKGGIISKALDLWRDRQNNYIGGVLGYPFKSLWDVDNDTLAKQGLTPEKAAKLIQLETFAQLGRLYESNPPELQADHPDAYNLFRRIHELERRNRSKSLHNSRRAVLETLRRTDSAGGVQDAGAGDGWADRGRAGDGEAGGLMVRSTRDEPRGVPEPAAADRRGKAIYGRLKDLPEHSPGPHGPAQAAAARYMKSQGRVHYPPTRFAKVDKARAKGIADAYEAMKHDPNDPEVKASYKAMAEETIAQWHAMMRTGIKVDFADKEHPYPYDVPNEVLHDIKDNNHMTVFPTEGGFGKAGDGDVSDNPLLKKSGIVHNGKELLVNDVFRAVHDFFGHAQHGVTFRANGEENAWRSHVAMYSPLARKAMTTETRGQNSWLNWGPHGEKNRTAKQGETVYAEQKTGLLPDKYIVDNHEGMTSEAPPQVADLLTKSELSDVNHGYGRVRKLLDAFSEETVRKLQDAAAAGRVMKDWYKKSLDAIVDAYGKDHRQFLQLMAALSPQTDVRGNFYNAARAWHLWETEGRPKDPEKIARIFDKTLLTDLGREDGKKAMEAWTQNGIRVLSADDVNATKLSGPKVSSFMENLLGNYVEVTNDRHMADFAGIKLDSRKVEGLRVKGPAYMALNAMVRKAAKNLGWEPAEVQAAAWSWWKALKTLVKETGQSAVDLLKAGELTVDRINAVPHLGSYLHEPEYREIDEQRGGRAARNAPRGEGHEGSPLATADELAPTPAVTKSLLAQARKLDTEKLISSRAADDEIGGLETRHSDEKRPIWYSGMDRAIAAKAPFSKSGEIDARMLHNWLEARTKDGTVKRDELEWSGLGEYLDMRARGDAANINRYGPADTIRNSDGSERKISNAPKVTRDEVQRFLDQNGVKVEEHELGKPPELPNGWKVQRITEPFNVSQKFKIVRLADGSYVVNDSGADTKFAARSGAEAFRDAVLRHWYDEHPEAVHRDMMTHEVVDEDGDQRGFGQSAEDALHDAAGGSGMLRVPSRAKYEERQLPGGQNYRELLLTLPRNSDARFAQEWKERTGVDVSHNTPAQMANLRRNEPGITSEFRSSHFDQPNVLAHVRFNERTDANGKRVLFLEELQSDWAQRGRKEGFQDTRQFVVYDRGADSPSHRFTTEAEAVDYAGSHPGTRAAKLPLTGIPPAPFVGKTEAWVALAMKRMIRYAADHGFDRVAWTNGEQQAARYDLSKQVSSVAAKRWGDTGRVSIVMTDNDGHKHPAGEFDHKDLPGVVGKELAEKIARDLPPTSEEARSEKVKVYAGLDLKVGGEGMKAFYDQIIPNVANDVLKKMGGGRVGEVRGGPPSPTFEVRDSSDRVIRTFDNSAEAGKFAHDEGFRPPYRIDGFAAQPGFDITPAMKAKVEEGQPLFVKDGKKVPDKDLAPKIMGGKAADAEQQFTKSGEVVTEKPKDDRPEWVLHAATDNPNLDSFLRKGGAYVVKETWRQRWARIRKDMGTKILQATTDQFRSVLDHVSEYSYQLLRMASSGDNGVIHMLERGHIFLNKWGAIDVKVGTKSLREIMAPLMGEHERFLLWIAANRANKLMAEDREHLFKPEELAEGMKLNTVMRPGDEWKGEGSRTMAYAKALKEFHEMNKSVLDFAEAAGTLDPEVRKLFESEFYVNFRRDADPGEPEFHPSNISGMVNVKGIERLKGGENQLHDLMENTLANWRFLINAGLRNNAAWHTLQEMETQGTARVLKAHEVGKGDVFVLQGGRQVYYRIDDPLVAQALGSLQTTGLKGPIADGLRWMKHALTVGTTWGLPFRIRHTIREQVTALASGTGGYNLPKNWWEGVKYSSADNPEWGRALAGGAAFHMGLDIEGNNAAYAKRLIAHGIDPKTMVATPLSAKRMLSAAGDWWRAVGERSDWITRANRYKQTLAKLVGEGMDPERAHFIASYEAKDVCDYSLHGALPAIRMLSQMIPFMNARMQGLYKLGRAAGKNPQRFGAVVGGAALATIALSLANRNNKAYQSASDWDHDNNWLVPVGDIMFRIPKPFEVGAIATIVDRGLKVLMGGLQPTDREKFAGRVVSIVGSQLNMNPIPQALSPMVQVAMNKNWFSWANINSEGDMNLSPAQRIGASTTLPAEWASSAMQAVMPKGVEQHALSPKDIDFLVSAYFSWVGQHVMATIDMAGRAAGMGTERPTRRINDYMLAGDFIKQLPQNESQFVEDFYNHITRTQEAVADMHMLMKAGQQAQAIQMQHDKKDLLALAPIYAATQKQMGVLNSRIRYVQMRNDMTPDKKRDTIDALSQIRNQLAANAEAIRAKRLNQ